MSRIKIFLGLCILIISVFVIGLLELGYRAFFEPKHESVNRYVFENTKSYVYGAVQDIAKYKKEYEEGDDVEKKIIANALRERFANFDPDNINSMSLRDWFIQTRGY